MKDGSKIEHRMGRSMIACHTPPTYNLIMLLARLGILKRTNVDGFYGKGQWANRAQRPTGYRHGL